MLIAIWRKGFFTILRLYLFSNMFLSHGMAKREDSDLIKLPYVSQEEDTKSN